LTLRFHWKIENSPVFDDYYEYLQRMWITPSD